MDPKSLELSKSLVNPNYIQSGTEALATDQRLIRNILAQRRLPEEGLSDPLIEYLLHQLSLMDSNNFPSHVGAGEREGRVHSPLVQKRHFYMSHGIGRSGDISADQPKASGSSLMYQLTNIMALDAIKLAGASHVVKALVIPMATGMTMSLVLRSIYQTRVAELKQHQNKNKEEEKKSTMEEDATVKFSTSSLGDGEMMVKETSATSTVISASNPSPLTTPNPMVVIWPRIDQKTCLKCIYAAGFQAHVVELRKCSSSTSVGDKKQKKKEEEKNEKPQKEEKKVNEKERAEEEGSKNQETIKVMTTSTTTSFETGQEGANNGSSSCSCFLQCHVDDIEAAILQVGGAQNVLCVFSTTSCFAPRLPDDTLAISRCCLKYNIPYVINNAYGTQSTKVMMKRLNAAMQHGRVDCVIQSGDKNFLVPVGGSIVASPTPKVIESIASLYAGRASGAPITDLFITFLSLGRRGLMQYWESRYQVLEIFHAEMKKFAESVGEEVIVHQGNDISFGMTLRQLWQRQSASEKDENGADENIQNPQSEKKKKEEEEKPLLGDTTATTTSQQNNKKRKNNKKGSYEILTPGELGSKLFYHCVSGPRIISPSTKMTSMCNNAHQFCNYGMHSNAPLQTPMLIVACGIGMTMSDVHGFMVRLKEAWGQLV